MVPETLPTPSLYCGYTISASHPTYHLSLNGTFGNCHIAFDLSRALQHAPSDRQLLFSLIKPAIHYPGNHLGGLNANQSHSFSSHVTYSHYPSAPNNQNGTTPFVSLHLPSHQSFSSSMPYWLPHHPKSTEFHELDLHFHFLPPRDSITLSYSKQGTCVIEYGGSWLTEEELIKSLMEASRKVNIFQCHWEENHTPCHLWIKGDKSSINTHIQRWHRGKPGGNKLKAECHWSSCRMTMLKKSIARHIVGTHLGKMWECQGCGKETTQYDVHR